MKRQLRFALIAAALLVLLASASIVFATHESEITGLSCNFETGVVTLYGTYSGAGGGGSTIGGSIYAGGVYVVTRIAIGPSTKGPWSLSVSIGGLNVGDEVEATDGYAPNWDATALCGTAPSSPEGFVLRRIICDTAVYDSPGGSPVDDDHITAGQTWYVSPDPEEAADGTSWTAIYTGGYQLGYILTSCLGEFV